MTIFGIRIMRESDYDATIAIYELAIHKKDREVEYWSTKFCYAKAQAIVSERFPHKTTVTLKPRGKGVVEVEVTRG